MTIVRKLLYRMARRKAVSAWLLAAREQLAVDYVERALTLGVTRRAALVAAIGRYRL